MNLQQRIAAYCFMTLVILSYLTPSNPAFAASRIAGCQKIPGLDKKVPVELVHGFISSPTIWDDTLAPGKQSMMEALNQIQGVYLDEPFDYQKYNQEWVDNQNIGVALAKRIDYLAQASLCSGGSGKVIVIAHSMGGLAVRFAAHYVLPGGHKVSDDIGLVITIATPNFGSLVADVGTTVLQTVCFVPGLVINFAGHLLSASPDLCDNILPAMQAMQTNIKAKLASLPMLPLSIPLMGIAGDVQSQFGAFDTKITVSSSDTVVLVNSALVGSYQQNQGAGTAVFHCQYPVPFFAWASGDCSHNELPKNPAVQAQVVKSINRYLSATLPSPCPPEAGTCVGIHSGDMDGDGVPDRVGVTWLPNTCANGTPSSCRIDVHIILDNGDVIDGIIPWLNAYGYNITFLQFMGLSDINGDGRDEVFLKMDGDCGACSVVLAYELRQGNLQQLMFPNSDSSIGVGLSLGIAGFGAGFTCQVVNGHHQILAASWDINSNQATEWLYQANADGTMSLIKQDTTIYTTQQENAAEGAHCPGLSVS